MNLGRGLYPLPRNFDFELKNGEILCILGASFYSSAVCCTCRITDVTVAKSGWPTLYLDSVNPLESCFTCDMTLAMNADNYELFLKNHL